MTEFQFEHPDLNNRTLEIGLPSCAIAKDNFPDSQGKQIRIRNKFGNKGEICVAVAVAVLVA